VARLRLSLFTLGWVSTSWQIERHFLDYLYNVRNIRRKRYAMPSFSQPIIGMNATV